MTTEERAGAMLDFIKTMDRGGYEVIGHYGPWHWRLLMWLKDIPRRIRRSIRIAAPAK